MLLLQGNSTTYVFLIIFQFLTHFETPSRNHMWWSLVGFWVVDYSPVLYYDYIKSDSTGGNFLKNFIDEIIPMMNSYFESNRQYF